MSTEIASPPAGAPPARRAPRGRRRRRSGSPGRPLALPPIPEAIRRRDPLAEPRRTPGARLARLVVVVALALAAHGLLLAAFFGASAAMDALARARPPDSEAIEVAVVEPPPPPPPPEPPPPEKPAAPAPPPPPRPVKKAPAAPPPDPVKARPPPVPLSEPPRPVVGLDFESTVEGGAGPAFATGNTRMGTTERKAEKPGAAAPLPPSDPPPSANRAATHLPTAGVALVKPERQKQVVPVYPEKYRQQGIEADVVVRVTIDPEGRVKSVEIVTPAGYPEFNDAARAAARGEVFSPALRDGKPIEYTLTYTYRFRLDD